MNLILRTIPDLLVMSWIPSETPNKLHLHTIFKSTHATSNLKRVTLRFVNYADMVETPLRAITNSGIWRSIMAPTYSTMTFSDRMNHSHTIPIPFVTRYFTCPRFDLRYHSIPCSTSSPDKYSLLVPWYVVSYELIHMLARH